MTILNQLGIKFILFVQAFPLFGDEWLETFWQLLTKFGDPKMVFIVYTPVIYPFSKHTAQEFLIAGAISEYLNMVFKWYVLRNIFLTIYYLSPHKFISICFIYSGICEG